MIGMIKDFPNDPFMNVEYTKARLRSELQKYGKLIIAYDFDYTVHPYRGESWTFEYVSNLLRKWRPYAHFVVFTASPKSRYPYIMEYLRKNNIPFETINEDVLKREEETRKIYYNVLLDDRAGLYETVKILEEILNDITN